MDVILLLVDKHFNFKTLSFSGLSSELIVNVPALICIKETFIAAAAT
jgi:hypothetical protein